MGFRFVDGRPIQSSRSGAAGDHWNGSRHRPLRSQIGDVDQETGDADEVQRSQLESHGGHDLRRGKRRLQSILVRLDAAKTVHKVHLCLLSSGTVLHDRLGFHIGCDGCGFRPFWMRVRGWRLRSNAEAVREGRVRKQGCLFHSADVTAVVRPLQSGCHLCLLGQRRYERSHVEGDDLLNSHGPRSAMEQRIGTFV